MAKFSIDRMLARGANVATFWPLLPSGIIGVIAGFLSRSVAAISAYGAFGWLMAGLVAFLVSAAAIYAAALGFDRFFLAFARRKWARQVDAINPLDREFTRRRINLHELGHPVTGRIPGKRFVECELIGPANITLMGGGYMRGTGFINCDFVVVRDNAFINNTLVIEDPEVIGGQFIRCTIFINQAAFDRELARLPNINLITYLQPPPEGAIDAGNETPAV